MASGRKKEFVVEEVLDKAVKHFAAHGFARSSLSDLEATMGIGRQSLYDTFGDKRSLYLKGLQRFRETTFKELMERIGSAESHQEAIEISLRHFCDLDEDHNGNCLITQTLIELGLSDRELAEEAESMLSQLETLLESKLETAAQAGLVNTEIGTKNLTKAFVTSLLGHAVARSSEACATSIQDAYAGTLAMISSEQPS